MASFKAKFPVLQELFAKNHRGALCPPPAGRGLSNEAVYFQENSLRIQFFLYIFIYELMCSCPGQVLSVNVFFFPLMSP